MVSGNWNFGQVFLFFLLFGAKHFLSNLEVILYDFYFCHSNNESMILIARSSFVIMKILRYVTLYKSRLMMI